MPELDKPQDKQVRKTTRTPRVEKSDTTPIKPIIEKSRSEIAGDFARSGSSSSSARRSPKTLPDRPAKPAVPRATTAKDLGRTPRGEQPQPITTSAFQVPNKSSDQVKKARAYQEGDTLVFEKNDKPAGSANGAGNGANGNATNRPRRNQERFRDNRNAGGRSERAKELAEVHFAMSMKDMEDTSKNTPATMQRPAKTLSKGKTGKLRIIPLGGLGEIGKNIMFYETDNDIIIIDAGMTFPDETMPGIDLVLPDVTYLQENRKKIRGLVVTHAHEDHIGGIPYVWPKLNCPIYASDLTMGLIRIKLEDHGIENVPMHIIKSGDRIRLGDFEIEPVRVTHSIPDAFGFAIRTPIGLIAHFTDWKIDHTPISGEPFDFVRVAELSREGVKLFLSESTNIETPGYTISESILSDTFDNIFKNAKGRVIFTTFASMINRIQQAIDASVKYHRKIAISGRSLEKYLDEAMRLGFLKVPQGTMIDIRTAQRLPDHQVVYLTTGSQGEEYSALSRISSGEHRHIQVKRGDTVVISASIIPGNEASVFEVVNNLYKQGAQVIYGKAVDIHVSGHANEEELKMLMAMMKPEYFLPIHGEFRHLVKHGRMAERLGVDPNKIFIVENGGVIEFSETGVGSVGDERVQAGQVLVDGLGVGDVGNIVLRDRQAMAKDGIFVIIMTVDKQSGALVTSPDIISRGFVYMRAAEDLIFKSRQEIKKMFAKHNGRYAMNYDYIRRMIRDELGEFLFEYTQRRPMVIPVIIEV
jgi:ribonuclease J